MGDAPVFTYWCQLKIAGAATAVDEKRPQTPEGARRSGRVQLLRVDTCQMEAELVGHLSIARELGRGDDPRSTGLESCDGCARAVRARREAADEREVEADIVVKTSKVPST